MTDVRDWPHQETLFLAVSHHRVALRRADHIIVLKNGRVEAPGALDELLETCEEMQRLWHGDISEAKSGPGSIIQSAEAKA